MVIRTMPHTQRRDCCLFLFAYCSLVLQRSNHHHVVSGLRRRITYDCKPLHTKPQPIHNQTTWMFLRESYQEAVGPTNKATIALTTDEGLQVPHQVRQTRSSGRSVFATQSIQQGQLVWKPVQRAMFHQDDERSWRNFLALLPHDLACDVLQWAYAEGPPFPHTAVFVDLDPGSFLNHGKSKESINIGHCELQHHPHHAEGDVDTKAEILHGGCSESVWAIRDIQEGEELLMNYTTFSFDGVVPWFDDMVDEAWDEDDENSESEDEPSDDDEDASSSLSADMDGESSSSSLEEDVSGSVAAAVAHQLEPMMQKRPSSRASSRKNPWNKQLLPVGLGIMTLGLILALSLRAIPIGRLLRSGRSERTDANKKR